MGKVVIMQPTVDFVFRIVQSPEQATQFFEQYGAAQPVELPEFKIKYYLYEEEQDIREDL